ncbi:MAG TPA: NUDIX hydrolase [Cyanobacteria bacterium UBA11149]|nr:NUDIX hydrolase [Cyanobacteria bacterium UBA11367]HBE57940.1 NUDIX hydrolase [Cyanobacteria bacterium UBA11366]HBK66056.1 NUDIX hydrolase [Cyanobacteria bacterium UBA11166]HBR74445.1 NUDIX hydrolase [Cyanobacteria bacterium UBA11159]HBS68981.1 NUDIX hydrolase [Cyanobacteria bacterium UBA11153]HBW88534.1 NUDIX hydrolase [Cyanobacteria bacterium UBA11149]HCA93371.1 NUDIX hydrolase [Cyanobacteria bacterium UBA9226]
MKQEKIIFSTKWISVKETDKGFYYLERKGRDSVAIFLLRKSQVSPKEYDILIRQQPLCIDNTEINEQLRLYPCPITGGIDTGESPESAAIREVYEEAGYSVQVLPLGKYIIGTQTNEICYMYYADVTDIKPEVAQQDGSYFESISKNEWHPFDYLAECDYSACQIGYFRLRDILF